MPTINKTMARADLRAGVPRQITAELDALVRALAARNFAPSSWYGTLDLPEELSAWERLNRGYGYTPLQGAANDRLYPWFLYWEIAWLAVNNDFRPGQRLLDLGGASSLFSCYAASRGLTVTAVDLSEELVANGERIATQTGWKLRNVQMDMADLDLDGPFEHVTSVCV